MPVGSLKFFFDNNLSVQMADGMKAFGENVTHLQHHFSDNAKDVEWLPWIGENEYFLVSRDDAIRRHPAELASLKNAKVGAFFLGGKNRNRCEIIRQLVRNWPQIKQYADKTDRPFAFRVPPSGTKFDRINL